MTDTPERDQTRTEDVEERVFPPITRQFVDCYYDRTEGYSGCYDCGRRYGGAYGFPDLIVPDEVWERISPTGDQGGLLCPSCIVKRLAQEDIKCEAVWKSGPLEDRALRERLEEVEEERDEWKEVAEEAADHAYDATGRQVEATDKYLGKLSELIAARRRADRLEERAREVIMWGFDHEHDFPSSDWQETVEHLIDLGERIDRLHSALDSREDEGEELHPAAIPVASHDWYCVDEEAAKTAYQSVDEAADQLGWNDRDTHLLRCAKDLVKEALWRRERMKFWRRDCTNPGCPVHGADANEVGEQVHTYVCPNCGSAVPNHVCEAVHADEPEGDGMTNVQKARCIAYREGFGDGYDYARETGPPTDEPVSREGEKIVAVCSNDECEDDHEYELDDGAVMDPAGCGHCGHPYAIHLRSATHAGARSDGAAMRAFRRVVDSTDGRPGSIVVSFSEEEVAAMEKFVEGARLSDAPSGEGERDE